jgi:SAM-dependent methyltransferase
MASKPGGAYLDDLPASAEGKGYYEQRSTRDEYLAFHFPDGDPLAELLGPAAPPVADRYPYALRRFWRPRPDGLALDVGAACGRVTFAPAEDHRLAAGVDLSGNLVAAARAVQVEGRARYATVDEGELTIAHDVPFAAPPNARFAVADALSLPFRDAAFATVLGLNLVDRVPDPGRALDELVRVTAPGGRLIVASPYTWLATFTPRERWLGGYAGDGPPVRGSDSVRARLAPCCKLVEDARLPFFIQHHARSGQLGVALIQVHERNS